METICMKCQILFSMKNKKNIIKLSSVESDHRVVKVKHMFVMQSHTDEIVHARAVGIQLPLFTMETADAKKFCGKKKKKKKKTKSMSSPQV